MHSNWCLSWVNIYKGRARGCWVCGSRPGKPTAWYDIPWCRNICPFSHFQKGGGWFWALNIIHFCTQACTLLQRSSQLSSSVLPVVLRNQTFHFIIGPGMCEHRRYLLLNESQLWSSYYVPDRAQMFLDTSYQPIRKEAQLPCSREESQVELPKA